MKFRWSLAPSEPLLAGQLARELKLSALLAKCLINRGLTGLVQIGRFLEPRLKQLADPFLLPQMGLAVERLFRAREQGESLVIFGDYDVDGVTSTALLLEVFSRLGWKAQFYLPHRMDEGYGLSQDAVENCLNRHPATLLLAVDCGSTTVDSIAWLREKGVDVIVLDHHQISSPAPAATALVNPQQSRAGFQPASEIEKDKPATAPDSIGSSISPGTVAYQAGTGSGQNGGRQDACPMFTELCSVGLAFKLAHALVRRARELGMAGATEFDVRPLLDLVALGTIADLVPLTGENRILVSAGLERLNSTRRPGLEALKRVAQSPAPLGPYEVGFQLAPRLNAAGRLETAEEALHLLLARDLKEAMPMAERLDERNRERQRIEKTISEDAINAVRAKFKPAEDFVIVEGHAAWHIGVVGIVAARLLQQFYRPTIIVGGDGEKWRGSGRSIPGFDLAAALRECGDLLVRHGGHALAAGVTVLPGKMDEFRSRLNDLARRALGPEHTLAALRLDAEVGFGEVTLGTLDALDQLKPMGQGNPPVHLLSRNVGHQRPLQRMGAEKQHVKMWITDGAVTHEAVWWRAGNESLPVGKFDLAYAPQINCYNGRRRVQLKVLDWRSAE